jgi:hypothetical protein
MTRARPLGHRTVLRVALLLLAASAVEAGPQDQGGWKIVGQVGGLTSGVAVSGGYAYVGVGLRLVVLDVSNPTDLREVGVTQPFPHFVEDIAISGTLAYVAAGGAGLRVVDISNPASPTEIGAWDSRGYSGGVAVTGTTVYLADGPYGLRVVDVSKPSQPIEVGSAYSMNYAFKVAVQGHHAYVAAAGAGLLIADVADPRHPVEVGSLATMGYAYGVAVAGNVAYVADGWEGVKTVNVADPAHPYQAGAYKTPGWAFGVTVSGTTLYVADAFGGLRVLDVTDPAHPLEAARAAVPGGHARSVALAGNIAYVTDRNWGVRAVSLTGGPDLPQVGSYHPLGYADGVAVVGRYAYVAAGDSGLRVVDLFDPSRPRQVGAVDLPAWARDVAVSGTYACLATGRPVPGAQVKREGTLEVVDISDPAHPISVAFYVPVASSFVDLVGSIAYITTETGLELVSLADPHHPVQLAFLHLNEPERGPNPTQGVAVSGTIAYVASQTAGVRIVDVSDPHNPFKVGAYDAGSHSSQDVAVVGNTLYVADGPGGLRVVDVSDPAHSIEMGTLGIVGGAYGVAVAGNLAYVANGAKGLVVADLSDPYRPTLAGAVQVPGFARQVAVADERAYLADGTSGLVIVEKTTGASAASVGVRLDAGWAMDRSIARLRPLPSPKRGGHVWHGEARTETARARSAPQAASTCVVTSVADGGAGTLRWCLENPASGTTITFDPTVFPPSNPVTIRPASKLPGVNSGNVTIDGSDAGVILDGSGLTEPASGLFIPSDGNTVRGLQIVRFSGDGVSITGSHNVIGGDRSLGRGPVGQGNLISGNGGGVGINGGFGTASSNTVVGNLIGIDLSGTKAFGNTGNGVFLPGGASNNRIGGLDPRDRNIVSANGNNGITVNAGSGNFVIGNYVGTDVTGTIALGNHGHGVSLEIGAFNNVVQGDLSSGNGMEGVCISDPGSSYNAVVGNRLGTDTTGTKAIPNGGWGVQVGTSGGTSFNRIGGTRPEEQNLISGNDGGGLGLDSGDLARGNLIGTDITGRRALPNASGGVGLGGSQIHLGGERADEANVISGNSWSGIGSASDYNYIAGNYIGTDSTGQVALGNNSSAVYLAGMHSVLQSNVVANSSAGIVMGPLSCNTLRRNSIYGNAGQGIAYSRCCGPAAPVITIVGATRVVGTACAGCDVEIFSDSGNQGRVFEGGTVSDASGAFTFTKSSGHLTGPDVTATATDTAGNTSEFSEPKPFPGWPARRHLPRR